MKRPETCQDRVLLGFAITRASFRPGKCIANFVNLAVVSHWHSCILCLSQLAVCFRRMRLLAKVRISAHMTGVIILIVSRGCESQKMGLFPFNPSLRG